MSTGDRLFSFVELQSWLFPVEFLGLRHADFLLTRDDASASYAIILHNVRTYKSAGVVAIVRGKQKAELALKQFQDSNDTSNHHEGWRYFIEKTDLAVGTDPEEATSLRQADLERRESKAPEESEPDTRPSSNSHK